jgi:hypothetical protein
MHSSPELSELLDGPHAQASRNIDAANRARLGGKEHMISLLAIGKPVSPVFLS